MNVTDDQQTSSSQVAAEADFLQAHGVTSQMLADLPVPVPSGIREALADREAGE